jgi:hypothetical protein
MVPLGHGGPACRWDRLRGVSLPVKVLAAAGGTALLLGGGTLIVEPLLLKAPTSESGHLRASGPATFLDTSNGNPRTGTFVQDLTITRHPGSGSATTASFDQRSVSRFVDASGRSQQIADSSLTQAFDRSTGAGRPGEQGDTVGTTAHLYKLPFGTQKRDYAVWDETAKRAVPLRYKGTKVIDGLTTYVFSRSVPPTDLGELPVFKSVPGSFLGLPTIPSVAAHEWYENTSSTLYVEPVTGSLVGGDSSPHLWAQTTAAPVGRRVDLLAVHGAAPSAADAAALVRDAKAARSKVVALQRLPYLLGGVGLLLLAGAGLLSRGRKPGAAGDMDVHSLLPAPRTGVTEVGISQ